MQVEYCECYNSTLKRAGESRNRQRFDVFGSQYVSVMQSCQGSCLSVIPVTGTTCPGQFRALDYLHHSLAFHYHPTILFSML